METRVEGRRRSTIATLALAATVISAVGLAILLVGIAFDIEGASEGEDTSGWRVIFDIAWLSWLFGSLAALVTGAIAYWVGRKNDDAGTSRIGLIALGWFVVSLVIFLIVGATQ